MDAQPGLASKAEDAQLAQITALGIITVASLRGVRFGAGR